MITGNEANNYPSLTSPTSPSQRPRESGARDASQIDYAESAMFGPNYPNILTQMQDALFAATRNDYPAGLQDLHPHPASHVRLQQRPGENARPRDLFIWAPLEPADIEGGPSMTFLSLRTLVGTAWRDQLSDEPSLKELRTTDS